MGLFDSYDKSKHEPLDPFGVGSLFDFIVKGNGSTSNSARISNPRGSAASKIKEIMAAKYPPKPLTQPTGLNQSDIFSRLEELANPSRYMTSPEDILRQARESANAQYNPLIERLKQQMGAAQTRGETSKRKLGEMYSSLSGSLAESVPQVEQQFEGTKQSTGQEYDQLKKSINDQYSQTAASQEEMMKRLNIQAAAPDALEGQQRDQNYFAALADKEGQTQQSAIGQEQRGATEYTRRGSEIAKFEGTNRQSDLEMQLQELLGQLGGEVGAQEAARDAAANANVGTLSQQMEDRARKLAQGDYSRFLEEINLGRGLRKDDAELAPKVVTKVNSPADIGGRALAMGLSPSSAQRIQSTFLNAIGSNPNILAGIDSKFGNALPKEALAYEVVAAGRQAGLSMQEINALQTMALEYFGRS